MSAPSRRPRRETGPSLRLAADSEALRALVEIRLDDLAEALTEIAGKLDAAQVAGSNVDTLGNQLQEDLAGLGAQLDGLPQAITALLQRVLRSAGLGIRVTPGDEFTHHDGATLGLIRQAQAELVRMPPGRGYSVAALAVGSALSSAEHAEGLFVQALDHAAGDPERALAAYNLFQARLRQGPGRYPDALEALRQAVRLDPVRYATHEEWKYPTEAVLGAGGMGCAFLCRQPVKGNRRVVVKTFWRAAPGAVEDTFAEATTMDRVGRAHVPGLLDYGFAQGGKRPYIVMEYLDGYQDGEAWLKDHGPLPLADGLDLGRRVLEALVTAPRGRGGPPRPQARQPAAQGAGRRVGGQGHRLRTRLRR
jgi:tetratricopeptide (TPR) repeat protein